MIKDELKFGWICPKCERVISPFVEHCPYCEPVEDHEDQERCRRERLTKR